MSECQNVRMSECQLLSMLMSMSKCRMSKCQNVIMLRCQNVRMSGCQKFHFVDVSLVSFIRRVFLVWPSCHGGLGHLQHRADDQAQQQNERAQQRRHPRPGGGPCEADLQETFGYQLHIYMLSTYFIGSHISGKQFYLRH